MITATNLKEAGNVLSGQQKYSQALEKYNEAIQLDPTLVPAWLNKGLMHRQLQQIEEAIAAFEKALELDPNYSKASWNLAEIFVSQNNYKKAQPLFQSALKQHPNNTNIYLSLYQCEQFLPARFIFTCVDLKLTEKNKVKILEFGRGMQSGFMGLKIAYNIDIVELLHKKIKEFNLPPLVLNSSPGMENPNQNTVPKELSELKPATLPFNPEKLRTYRGIYAGTQLKKPNQSDILLGDDNNLNFIFEDKNWMHEAFIESDNLAVRPKTLQLEKKYTPQLAKKILQEFPQAKYLALKGPDLERGEGVIIVTPDELDIMLYGLLIDKKHPENAAATSMEFGKRYYGFCNKKYSNTFRDQAELMTFLEKRINSMQNWVESESRYFLVEEYITNKAIQHNNNLYDATMRVAFLCLRDEDITTCEPIACYWKLPPEPISDSIKLLRESTVSSFTETRQDSAKVDSADQKIVYDVLKKVIPSLFDHMMKWNLHQKLESVAKDTKIEASYKSWLYMRFSNSLALGSELRLADYYLNKAKELTPNNFFVFHQQGIIYHLKGEFNKAIEAYSAALKINPKNTASYYRRGISRLHLEQTEAALNDFKTTIQLDPSYEKKIRTLPQFSNILTQLQSNMNRMQLS